MWAYSIEADILELSLGGRAVSDRPEFCRWEPGSIGATV